MSWAQGWAGTAFVEHMCVGSIFSTRNTSLFHLMTSSCKLMSVRHTRRLQIPYFLTLVSMLTNSMTSWAEPIIIFEDFHNQSGWLKTSECILSRLWKQKFKVHLSARLRLSPWGKALPCHFQLLVAPLGVPWFEACHFTPVVLHRFPSETAHVQILLF